MKKKHREETRFLVGVFLVTLLLLNLCQTVRADMPLTEANSAYSVRFQDWVYVYLNNEFIKASFTAPDYSVEMKKKVVNNSIRFVVTGYYFDTKLGNDWYLRYGSQIASRIALLCHTWTQQGFAISPDDFEIQIEKEAFGGSR